MAAQDPLSNPGDGLLDPEAGSVDDLAKLHQEHARRASALQRAIGHVTAAIARPPFAVGLVVVAAAWALAAALDRRGFQSPTFAWLELAATVTALITAVLILVTQRRDDELAERRAQLNLQLALLGDRRSAKIIALLEELRRDAPELRNRFDAESHALATPADPQKVLHAIEARERQGPG